MRREALPARPALVAAVIIALLLPSLALGSPPLTTGARASQGAVGPALPVSAPRATHAPVVPPVTEGPLTVAEIHQDLLGRGVPAGAIHLPALFAEGTHHGTPVAPTYSSAPAPMGVADIGLRDVSGSLVGYELTTSSAEGTASLTDAQSVYVDGDGPDMFGLQLNSVLTNVTLFGNSTYQFWTQDFVSYTSSSGELSFGDNLWNFSSLSGEISSNALYAYGPNGSLVAPVFYYAVGPTFTIRYPFTVTFYLNATEIANRPAVYFNYTLENTTFRASGSFDYVIFNSSVGAPGGPAPPAIFQIDGNAYDPVGLINDIELTLVGNDNGDTTTFFQVNASFSIAYWNATRAAYQPVPSAVNAGADTGETSDGVASYYTGTSAVAHLGLGPSFLSGLWNSTTAPGVRTVVSTVTPLPVMILLNPGTTRNASAAQWVPTSSSGTTTFYIPNTGPMFFDFLLSEYAPASLGLATSAPNGTLSFSGNLGKNTSYGIYTPLIAWGNTELATFAASGAGTAASPYVLYDNEAGPLDPEFTQLNDFGFPVFPGLLLIQTTAYLLVTPPSFRVNLPITLCGLVNPLCVSPVPNDLQLEFWNVSHVVLEGGTIAGWLLQSVASFFPLGEVIFWNSTDDLVANITFEDQGSAIALYGGGSNVIWGNRFLNDVGQLPSDPSGFLGGPDNQSGIWESESGDLVYNNYFAVPSPAYTPTFDPLSCQVACTGASYLDRWNVSRESADASETVLGVVLTGSIIGTSYQGGNYWSNYGVPSNPYGDLPYVDRPSGTLPPAPGEISVGGDYVPLVPFALYSVTIHETGLPSGTLWSVNSSLANLSATTPSVTLEAPNGTYPFTVTWPASLAPPYVLEGPSEFTVDGSSLSVDLVFLPEANVTFAETGLEPGTWWTLTWNGTGLPGSHVVASPNASVSILLGPGNYSFAVSSPGYTADPASGTIGITNGSAVTVTVVFTGQPVPLWLAFVTPSCAQVSVDGGAASARTCGAFRTNVTPGVGHLIEATAPGYYPYFVNVTLFVGAPVYPINVSMLPRSQAGGSGVTGALGDVLLAVLLVLVLVFLAVVVLRYRARRPPGPPPLVPVPQPVAAGATAPPSPSGTPAEWSEEEDPGRASTDGPPSG